MCVKQNDYVFYTGVVNMFFIRLKNSRPVVIDFTEGKFSIELGGE